MNMITGTITKEQLTSLSSRCNSEDCARIEKGFIGPDGEHHNYEYDKSDYQWHSHITKEEWMKKNNSSQLEYCQKKCPLWERCRHQEYTILTNGWRDREIVR